MPSLPSRRAALLVVALATLFYRSGNILQNAILFKKTFPQNYYSDGAYSTDCKYLRPTDPGPSKFDSLRFCEDAALWDLRDASGHHSSHLVVASCDANRKAWNTVMGPMRDPNPHGALWVYTPPKRGAPETEPQRIELRNYPASHDFHPLGLELWPSYGGNASYLYVVNHARHRTVIEQFSIEPSRPTIATHIRTLSSKYFLSPNSIALTSPNSFYVTNDHLITRRWGAVGTILATAEAVLGLPLAFVSHVSLKPPQPNQKAEEHIASHEIVSRFFPFPNGVALSPDGETVAVASSSLGQIRIFNRDPATNALKLKETVIVPFAPDNLRWTPSESNDNSKQELIVAGHPAYIDLVKVAKNVTGATAPSWVVSLTPKDRNAGEKGKKVDVGAPVSIDDYVSASHGWAVRTLFQSDGKEGGFATSTCGIRDPDTNSLYISGLYSSHGVLACHAPS